MKKLVSGLLIVSLGLFIVGCTNDTPKKPEPTKPVPTKPVDDKDK